MVSFKIGIVLLLVSFVAALRYSLNIYIKNTTSIHYVAWEADDGEKSTSAVLVEQKKATTSTSASIRVSAGLVEQNSKEAHGGEKSGLHH